MKSPVSVLPVAGQARLIEWYNFIRQVPHHFHHETGIHTFLVPAWIQACLQQSSKSLRHFHWYVGCQQERGATGLRRSQDRRPKEESGKGRYQEEEIGNLKDSGLNGSHNKAKL